MVHIVTDSEDAALERARTLTTLIGKQGSLDLTAIEDTDLGEYLPDSAKRAYDVHPLVEHFLDAESMVELHEKWAPNIVTALGRLGGRTVGVVANNLVTGIVIELHDDASRATADIRTVVSSAVVLTSRMANLVRVVAERYAGTFADVVRFAVPTRHAKTETAALQLDPQSVHGDGSLTGIWTQVKGGEAFFVRAARGEAVAACVEIPAKHSVIDEVAAAARAASASMSVVIVVPDARDIEAMQRALRSVGIEPVVIRAADGPAARQRAFTTITLAQRTVVIGTRSAVFALSVAAYRSSTHRRDPDSLRMRTCRYRASAWPSGSRRRRGWASPACVGNRRSWGVSLRSVQA